MPLEWKTTEVKIGRKTAKVLHLAKYDAEDIVNALKTRPVKRFSGSLPRLSVHQFGRHLLAKRIAQLHGFNDLKINHEYNPPAPTFYYLMKMAELKKAVVEMPVALITREDKPTLMVTLWKKHDRTLKDALFDDSISDAKKLELGKKAMRQLAKLHSAGFIHQHPFARNFVVLKNGSVRLIDPTILAELSKLDAVLSEKDVRRDSYRAAENIARWLIPTKKPRLGIWEATENKLLQTYHDEYARLTEKPKWWHWILRMFDKSSKE